MSVCGWPSPGDSCGCDEAYTEQTISLPPASVSGAASCSSPGNDGWCLSGASLDLSASEPLSGRVIEIIEGSPGGLLCDPADSASVACSYSGGGEGNFTIEFWAVSSYGDTSDKGSASWKLDGSSPSVDLHISGGNAGGVGWYRGGTLSASASGADAVSGIASAEVSVNGGGWASSAQISEDGVHSIQARAIDHAGNQATDSAEVRIDGSPPSLDPELSGTKGRDGWYISPVTVFASASDGLSGVSKIEVSSGSGGWQSAPMTISADGVYKPKFRAEDVAGNESTEDGPTVRIDTHPPQSAFVNPPEGSETWVSGEIPLIGQSSDVTSGLLAVEISYDEGSSWSTLERSGGDWRTTWDASDLPNGSYVILARAGDVAGNIESTARITLRVDNAPPFIDIQEEWEVTETGTLDVEDGEIGLGGVEVVISDEEKVLQKRQYDAMSVPGSVSWDGSLPDGSAAAPGEYAVVAVAWDKIGNRASDEGRIIVPEPEPPEVLANVIEPRESSPVEEPSAPNRAVEDVEPDVEPVQIRVSPWIWPAIAWIGLLTGLGIAKMSDPRPKALRGLHDDIAMIQNVLRK